MVIAESKGDVPAYATANNDEGAAAKDTTVDNGAEAKDTDTIMESEMEALSVEGGVEEVVVDGEVEAVNVACDKVETVNVEVEEVVADLITAVTVSAGERPETPATIATPRKRHRAVLQDSSEDECDGTGLDEAPSPTSFFRVAPPPCVVNGDANLMDSGAEKSTYLNSDEDPDEAQDCEDDNFSDMDGDDDWVEDWDIGELKDEESDDGGEALPESVCNSVAQNKKSVSMMRTHGWEYGTYVIHIQHKAS
ncbi:hypothetical protein DVH05_001464 [Phytophthora capsici]|nr:hypothetical protein DVH05_001464 [Phytophthora capsici]